MDSSPPNPSTHRRGSLSLSQTLSLDWAAPPPPADLDQIHASSSQAPGLTSFSLGSPPSRHHESAPLTKFYSRVKSIASSVIDAVGPNSDHESPPKRSFMSLVNSDRYAESSASRDSVHSTNTSSEIDPKSPSKAFSPTVLLKQPGESLHSRPSSRVSSHHSISDITSPPTLRKSSLLGSRKATTPVITPVNALRHELGPGDGHVNAGDSRSNSPFLNRASISKPATSPSLTHPGDGSKIPVLGTVKPIEAQGQTVKEEALSGDGTRQGYADFPDDGSESGGETSDSTDEDDVVMLHSKLPGRAAQRAPKSDKKRRLRKSLGPALGGASMDKQEVQRDSIDQALTRASATPNGEPHGGSRRISADPRLNPFVRVPFLMSSHSESNLPRLNNRGSLDGDSQANIPVSSRTQGPASTGSGPMKRGHPLARLSTDKISLLPSFRFGRASSNADLSPASVAGSTAKMSSSTVSGRHVETGMVRTANGTHGGGLAGSTEAVSQALRQLRSGNLTRDFWMKDELCKECFVCQATFTAWRRKHHCRLCGQIFCSKCTTLISGDKFGHQGSMRVCKPCLTVVNEYKDDSDSDDFSPSAVYGPSRFATATGVPQTPQTPQTPQGKLDGLRPGQTPLMAIPATRMTAANNPNRRSQILEIDAELPSPPRPQSVRSVNALSRPMTAASSSRGLLGSSLLNPHSHKYSRSHHRSWAAEERAPFDRVEDNNKRHSRLFHAFNADDIIDSERPPYMSDDDLSDEQQLNIFATIAPKFVDINTTPSNSGSLTPATLNKERGNDLSNTPSARARRAKSKSRGSISGINVNLGDPSGNLKISQQRSTRRRGHSFIAPLSQRPATRGKSRGLMGPLSDSLGRPSIPAANSSPRANRSGSIRGPLGSQVELNTASLQHVKKLLRQLLSDAGIPNVSQWERALLPTLLKCTDDLDPDVRGGDDIDIRHYVKVKRIPGGRPSDTTYISGVVCSKNLALKSMPRHISNPRIVVLAFPIEYKRHQMKLMSLEPVIAQEKEYLQNMVNRIIALRPTLLLVEKNISGLALQLLAQANIATAHLVKTSVIEAVSRCAQADLFTSVDKLALSHFRLGKCASFDVKTFVSEDIPNRKKTFMFFDGCQKELGCTIVLRGADMSKLAVIKQITEFMVYVVYNLKLETCLMRDEFLVIPSSPTGPQVTAHLSTPTPITGQRESSQGRMEAGAKSDSLATKPVSLGDVIKSDASLNAVEDTSPQADGVKKTNCGSFSKDLEMSIQRQELQLEPGSESALVLPEDRLPDDIPNPTYYEDMVRKHETKILSASPFVSYMQPYLLTRARGLERRLIYLRRLRDALPHVEDEDPEKSAQMIADGIIPEVAQQIAQEQAKDPEKVFFEEIPSVSQNFQLVNPAAVHGQVKQATKKSTEVLRAIYDAEYDKVLHVYETQKRQWENYLQQYDDLFDPFAHQSITMLCSVICTPTTVPCEGPEIRRLEFYYQDYDWFDGKSDCALGQYVEYLIETAHDTCGSLSCERKMIEHHRSYVHGQARVSVLVNNQLTCPIQGMNNQILMWSYCKKCNDSNTPAIPMSESTWKYSFGKYLELAFWSSEMKIRGAGCPHDTNRDQVKCFGYQGLTVIFQYDTIDLLEIVVPRTKITYQPEIDLRIKNEQFIQNEERVNRFFTSVKHRLNGINIESVMPEKQAACATEIQALKVRAAGDHAWMIAKLQEKYNKSKYYEIIPLNRALRALQEKVVEWDNTFSAFDSNYFPSEKDIRRLATLQLKKIFLDNTSTPSLPSEEAIVPQEDEKVTPSSIDGAGTSENESTVGSMSSEQAHDVLESVIKEDQGVNRSNTNSDAITPTIHCDKSVATSTMDSSFPTGQDYYLGNDDPTHRQEMIQQQTESMLIPKAAHSLPVSPVGNATPNVRTPEATDEAPNPLEAPSAIRRFDHSTRTSTTPASRLPIAATSSAALLGTKSARPARPGIASRTTSVPEVPRWKETTLPVQQFERGRSSTMPIKRTAERIRNLTGEKIKKLEDKKLERFRTPSGPKKPEEKKPVIPRSIPATAKRATNKVTSLAKHWEQLSKEFERERAREKRQLAAKRPRPLPIATSKPTVAVYHSVREAVEEASDDEGSGDRPPKVEPIKEASALTQSSGSTFKTISPVISREHTILNNPENVDELHLTPFKTPPPTSTHSVSDVDMSDGEGSLISNEPPAQNIDDVLTPALDDASEHKMELPQQHKSAWMSMLSKFWAERSATGWTSLDYPLHPTDHVFNDSDIIVREDEPSSLIAFALNGSHYIEKLREIRQQDREQMGMTGDHEMAGGLSDSNGLDAYPDLERALLRSTGTHLKYQFQEGTAKMFCKIFYAEQFDALRRNCGIADRYVESLSRCSKWDSKGGKSRSVFLKSQDERIVLKSLSPIETAAFVKFAPTYFQFMSEAFFRELPTVIAKMLGFYQISIKNPTTGTELKWDVLVMENLFYDRKMTRIFDLKGSMRNRYTQATGDQNEVLLDENMVEYIYESPLFVREHSKKLLRASLWNDTLFLFRQNVMDYSLMIGIDEERKELVVGIIDCIRTYTWDKKLESWVKARGLAGGGGGGGGPTVTSPKEYKQRFREAMERYVLEAPSCWHLTGLTYMGTVKLNMQAVATEGKSQTKLVMEKGGTGE
ncbi:hypothetical protein EX30DRAFT_395248 [Ascodesmis nigricans]|uniref:1-phosphatidylinositol-3-phosphate 5-kinase n=1 Tax=Ascodesmis nigricans TaxID=341454 RepID=A0A4S2MYL3_9PEZI|nr:hypothetical protein EX30DRAFT_395248 [Ascodesmis nigricans]